MRVLAAMLTTAFVFWAPASCSAGYYPSTYDRLIREAAETYLPEVPWRLGKAQLWQESHLKPDAKSPAGALGLAQFMPATWKEVTAALKLGLVDRTAVEPAITAWGYYMRQLRQRWRDTADLGRHKLALGGYNAGNGNIARAAKACDNSREWEIVASCLPGITGRFAAETTTYVRNIFRWWKEMEWGS